MILHISRSNLLFLALATFPFLLLISTPINDVDVLTQIKLGELAWLQGGLTKTEPFSFLVKGAALPYLGWMAQILFGWVDIWSSMSGVRVVHAWFFVLGFLLMGKNAISACVPQQVCRLFSLASGLVIAFLVSLSNCSVRPQGIAVFCFSLSLLVTQSRQDWKWKILLLLPILFVWQNSHPSLSMGILFFGGLLLSKLILVFKNKISFVSCLEPLLFIFLVLVFQFLTPDFFSISLISQKNIEISRYLLGISEWLPPWDSSVRRAMWPYFGGLAFTVFAIFKLWRKTPLEILLPHLVFLGLSLYAARFALFFALASIPFWVFAIENLLPSKFFAWRDKPIGGGKAKFYYRSWLGILLLLPFIYNPNPLSNHQLPLEGLKVLRDKIPEGRIYNYREWGGPLIYFSYPKLEPMIDGRLYLYSRKMWQNYYDEALGKISIKEITARYAPKAFFLHPGFHAKLIKLLEDQKDWKKEFEDKLCVVFVPSSVG